MVRCESPHPEQVRLSTLHGFVASRLQLNSRQLGLEFAFISRCAAIHSIGALIASLVVIVFYLAFGFCFPVSETSFWVRLTLSHEQEGQLW
jgi:hypothetical protein